MPKLYHSDLGLFQFQCEGVARCYYDLDNLAVWSTGIGKALALDQRVVTPQGWRTIGSLVVGDVVFGPNGLTTSVVGVYPQGRRPLWRVTMNDGEQVICDEEHLWAVRTRGMKLKKIPWRVRTLRQIMDMGLRDSGGGHRHFIPVTQPVVLPETDLPLDPYLVGVLLGDGGLTQRTARITSADPEIISNCSLPEGVTTTAYDYGTRTPSYALVSTRGSVNPVTDGLLELGLMGLGSHDKFIPESILWGSIEQRLACLQGLLDTDGYTGTSIEFCSVSEKLAIGVIHLVQSLGGTARSKVKPIPNGIAYRVRISMPSGLLPFRLQRKADAWSRTWDVERAITAIEVIGEGEAVCIKVDRADGLFLTEGFITTHNTHLAMALSALLFEDDLIDQVVVNVEKNKLIDWVTDYRRFTDLDVLSYKGTPSRRKRIREKLMPQVLVGVYETMRNDLGTAGKSKRHDWTPGPLTEALVGQRTLVVYDEAGRIGTRSSGVHKAQECLVRHLRRATPEATRTLGLTATPADKWPINIWDIGRIISPTTIGTWDEFIRDHVTGYNKWDEPNRFTNLGFVDTVASGVRSLREKLSPAIKIKHKADPDVVDQFPKHTEEFKVIELGDRHRDFYCTVREAFYEQEWTPQEERRLFVLLRQIAGHPLSLRSSKGKLAQAIWEQVGEDGLRALGSAKTDHLVKRLKQVCFEEGEKAIVFTFFGQSILHILHEELRQAGLNVVVNHGQMSDVARQGSINSLRYGDAQVFLSSDAGSRGLNLPEAAYGFNYELPLTFGNYVQRNDRRHRIDSVKGLIFTESFIVADTIEEAISDMVLRRNEWHDALVVDLVLDDTDAEGTHLTAEQRRQMIQFSKSRLLVA